MDGRVLKSNDFLWKENQRLAEENARLQEQLRASPDNLKVMTLRAGNNQLVNVEDVVERIVIEPTLPVITVGFCFGGSHAWRQSAGDLDLAGSAGFYGRPSIVGEAATGLEVECSVIGMSRESHASVV